MKGDNLPPRAEVVDLFRTNNLQRMRLYDPDKQALEALRGSGIEVMLGIPNEELEHLAEQDSAYASNWVQQNVLQYSADVKFKYIAVGNEACPTTNDLKLDFCPHILGAMQNIYMEVERAGLQDQIKVSTAVYSAVLSDTYPPSNSVFNPSVLSFMQQIVGFLVQKRAPLLANVYPFFAKLYDQNITPEFALFTSPSADQYGYQNLFDAMVDGFYYALEKVDASSLDVVVSESGWPDAPDSIATTENAQTYYSNLIQHVNSGSGTPKKPGKPIETYLFAMFDENLKGGDPREKHFGLFFPNKQPKYQTNFS
ncbi:PREDICTED: glucan endo-1,3-beta-glucosidase, acidic-like [Nelumbo nucifera]|nr:PREDICTED: glucan endo-1,3-beta-glucosidase, acidic-like [Nelumbo nucifera]